jgi:hypothetical protein
MLIKVYFSDMFIQSEMFGPLIMQVFDIREAAVFIPLGFGLVVGLVFAIISSLRHSS